MSITGRKPNRLINAKSPYLLQHAYNPVDWHPWGREAFEKARVEDKPIFLSIGYSTCHWCHVMERESFEDEEVADFLNRNFVSIKVDREERPDVDHVYMTVCQTLTAQGGWPLTIVMDSDTRPFFAGTYFPKHGIPGRAGLMDILMAIVHKWQTERESLLMAGAQITEAIIQTEKRTFNGSIVPEVLDKAYTQFKRDFDTRYGGFGTAPKFPSPHGLMFLMRYWYRTGNSEALTMVEKTLDGMRQGGLYDHLGYGFSRYSTDEQWLVPHFEKMLYDNALLTYAYLEGYQCTGNPDYARVADEVLTYISRDMTGPQGGFYSAEDADSQGEEGKFYVWRHDEIMEHLGREAGELFSEFYGVTSAGNFELRTTVLNHIGRTMGDYAAKNGRKTEEVEAELKRSREKLFEVREQRVHPYKDDKVLTAWNGLMIAAFAKGGRVLSNPEYTNKAKGAVDFIFKELIRDDGRLLARYRDGEAAYPAYLEDHAFLIWGLIELYETTLELNYLVKALDLAHQMEKLFWDERVGGFYYYGSDAEKLISRPKEVYDGAMPSGNSVAVWVLGRLTSMTGNKKLGALVQRTFSIYAEDIERYPKAYAAFLLGVDFHLSPARQIVITNPVAAMQEMLAEIGKHFMPNAVVLYNDPAQEAGVAKFVPHIQVQRPIEGKTTVYICENFACQQPITEISSLKQALERHLVPIQ